MIPTLSADANCCSSGCARPSTASALTPANTRRIASWAKNPNIGHIGWYAFHGMSSNSVISGLVKGSLPSICCFIVVPSLSTAQMESSCTISLPTPQTSAFPVDCMSSRTEYSAGSRVLLLSNPLKAASGPRMYLIFCCTLNQAWAWVPFIQSRSISSRVLAPSLTSTGAAFCSVMRSPVSKVGDAAVPPKAARRLSKRPPL
mmetsp:Transcript_1234/g.2730  ORF Transcript_1234/g.2730 Transcript_1234/m.2730 type:complete len:202 (-) Transcript_1234:42-647(-)